jgi:eukaryotic-like serine/threonine-protein kinase
MYEKRLVLYGSMAIILVSLLSITTRQLALAQTTTSISTSEQTNNNNLLTYEDPTYGIRIQYKPNWERIQFYYPEGITDILFRPRSSESTSDKSFENLMISVLPYNNTIISLDELVSMTIKDLGNKLIESKPTTLAGNNPAHMLVYTHIDSEFGVLLETMDLVTIKGDKIYFITYDADLEEYSSYLPTIQKIIDSFEIITK